MASHSPGGWIVASLVALTIYLLTPTSARVLLNGVPLAERAELLAFLGVAVAAGVAMVAWVLRLRTMPPLDGPARPRWRRWLRVAPLIGATALLVGLSLLKLAAPRDLALPLCLRSPEVQEKGCLWSPEGRGHPEVTRYEDRLRFDAGAGRPWRLGYLNTLEFNLYRRPPETPEGRRERFRRRQAHPFEARVTVPPHVADLLARDFVDETGVVRFSVRLRGTLTVTSPDGIERYAVEPDLTAVQATRFAVPRPALAGLTWVYRNYACREGPPARCAERMTFDTIRLSRAILDVRVVRPGGGGTVPLGYGHLLLARGAPLALAARWLETFALGLFAWGAVIGPVGAMLAARVRSAMRDLGVLEALLSPSAALALAALGYRVTTGRPPWPWNYGTIFDAGLSFWLTLPGVAALLLAGIRPRWRDRLGAVATAPRRSGLVLWLLPFVAYALVEVARSAPASDDATLWRPGDDNLSGASRGRSVLQHQTLAWEFASIAKSSFVYLRALGYLVLGEGERFTSIAVGAAFLVVYGLAAYGMFLACVAVVTRSASRTLRVATLVVYPTLLYWLAQALLAYGARHAARLFTEGPAWVPFVLAVVFLLRIATWGLDARLVAALGVAVTAAVLGRSNLLIWVPVFLVAPLALAPGGHSAWRVVLRGLLLPLGVGLGLAAAHATIVGAWRHVSWYLSVNTRLTPGASLPSIFGEPLERLFPSGEAELQLVAFATLYLGTLWREYRVSGWTPGSRWLLAFGGVLVLCGIVLQLPLLPAPYYPRMIMPTYFFLIILLPVWLDRWTRPSAASMG